MPEKDYTPYPLESIKVLPALEAVRKRPGFYYDLADPLLGAKLILRPLDIAIQQGVAGRVALFDQGPNSATVSWDEALSTDLRGKTGIHHAEALVSQLHAGCPPPELQAFYGLAVVTAACSRFDVTIHDNLGEWGQRYEKGVPQTDFELVGDEKGNRTIFSMELDTEFLALTVDQRHVIAWCSDHGFEVNLT